ncbi:hypothetical protein LZ30DRAFT_689712 [Colletotrichum cereale]|nr:hypothetical protein LZ30DRAFT_689712 [Colletotrichum cereale]
MPITAVLVRTSWCFGSTNSSVLRTESHDLQVSSHASHASVSVNKYQAKWPGPGWPPGKVPGTLKLQLGSLLAGRHLSRRYRQTPTKSRTAQSNIMSKGITIAGTVPHLVVNSERQRQVSKTLPSNSQRAMIRKAQALSSVGAGAEISEHAYTTQQSWPSTGALEEGNVRDCVTQQPAASFLWHLTPASGNTVIFYGRRSQRPLASSERVQPPQ